MEVEHIQGAFSEIQKALPFTAMFFGLYCVCRLASSATSATYRKLPEAQKGYWGASAVSSIHAVYAAVMGFRAAFEASLFTSDDFFVTTDATRHVNQVLLGYIMSDLTLAVWYGNRWSGWVANLFHHAIVVVSWSMMLAGGYGHFLLYAALL